ncbi:MAG TPA: TrbG/VirB9 family P-type conjugative transfer protein, partial [Thermoanaerobaculia bacterium]|nr:TrbG/VirB9 family P-type conjugative transfer protein [Thermoanaerobaculia bacterium]
MTQPRSIPAAVSLLLAALLLLAVLGSTPARAAAEPSAFAAVPAGTVADLGALTDLGALGEAPAATLASTPTGDGAQDAAPPSSAAATATPPSSPDAPSHPDLALGDPRIAVAASTDLTPATTADAENPTVAKEAPSAGPGLAPPVPTPMPVPPAPALPPSPGAATPSAPALADRLPPTAPPPADQLPPTAPPTAEALARAYRRTGVAPSVERPTESLFPFGHLRPVLPCAPLRACAIELESGELVLATSLGDSERWLLQAAAAGPGGRTPLLVVKPTACDLSTNLVIATDRRIYELALDSPPCRNADSGEATYNPHLHYTGVARFYYPDDLVHRWLDQEDLARAEA